jgi:hypothetical protein
MADPINESLIPEGQQPDPKKILQALLDHFSESELKTLCFTLEVNYEDLPPGGRSDKARSFVEYCDRHHRFQILTLEIRKVRGFLNWDDLTSSKPAARIKPQSPIGAETLIISKGVTALIKLMRSPEIREAAASFRADFEAASEQIGLMNDYKQIHDLFQELETRFFLIYNDQKRLPADESAWDNIELNEPEVRLKIKDIIETVQLASFASEEARWTQQLEKVQVDIRQGIETYDFKLLQSGTRLLYRVLNRQISRINAQLVATAGILRLDTLEQAMQTISSQLAQSDFGQDTISEVQASVNALSGLNTRVNELVREHNAWQELDDELRRVEGTLNQGIEELEDAWFDMEPMAQNLMEGVTDEWAVNWAKACEALDNALTDGTAVAVRRMFRRFRSQQGRRFRLVDMELLNIARELQDVGESLELLLMLRNLQ